jgi:hypothetical protein
MLIHAYRALKAFYARLSHADYAVMINHFPPLVVRGPERAPGPRGRRVLCNHCRTAKRSLQLVLSGSFPLRKMDRLNARRRSSLIRTSSSASELGYQALAVISVHVVMWHIHRWWKINHGHCNQTGIAIRSLHSKFSATRRTRNGA